jgi:anthranilate 1,2-dioxygenase small subunit
MTDPAVQYAVERLEARYAAAIDDDRLEDWPAFFTADCRYQITSRENYELQRPIGVLFANSRAMLADRVTALRQANIYEAQHYRHILSPSLIVASEGAEVTAQTNFAVMRIMHDGATMLFATGRYLDRIVLGSETLFAEKIVVCDSRRVDTLLAIPL